MSKATDEKPLSTAGTKGQEIVEGLRELADALKSAEPLGARFTVRTYKIAPPREYHDDGVREVRALLGMSQAAFAAFLGVDSSTIRSWEQGIRRPSLLACRVLSEIEADPAHWRARLQSCLIGPKTNKTSVEADPTLAPDGKRVRKK